jgi:KinB signaling pathway activation protein
LSLRKWMKMFGMSIFIGGLVSLVTGIVMANLDTTFEIPKAGDWLVNAFLMFLSGLTLGAFAHMGFFAYLMLNYIARSIFKRPYLWVTFQGFATAFALLEIVYNLYGSNFPNQSFWIVPLVITALSLFVAWRKVKETSSGSWIPALFFMVVVTVLEGNPAFRTGNLSSLIYMLMPLFICNTYQIMQLHRILPVSKSKINIIEAEANRV